MSKNILYAFKNIPYKQNKRALFFPRLKQFVVDLYKSHLSTPPYASKYAYDESFQSLGSFGFSEKTFAFGASEKNRVHEKRAPVMSACLPVKVPSVDRQVTVLCDSITTSLINLIYVCVRIHFTGDGHPKAFDDSWRSLWSGSSTTLFLSCVEDALTDFTATFTLKITNLSIAVKNSSCTLVSTVSLHYPLHQILCQQNFSKKYAYVLESFYPVLGHLYYQKYCFLLCLFRFQFRLLDKFVQSGNQDQFYLTALEALILLPPHSSRNHGKINKWNIELFWLGFYN